jgi:hypothetical protein
MNKASAGPESVSSCISLPDSLSLSLARSLSFYLSRPLSPLSSLSLPLSIRAWRGGEKIAKPLSRLGAPAIKPVHLLPVSARRNYHVSRPRWRILRQS